MTGAAGSFFALQAFGRVPAMLNFTAGAGNDTWPLRILSDAVAETVTLGIVNLLISRGRYVLKAVAAGS